MYEISSKARMLLYACAGWSENAHVALVRMHFFSLGVAYIMFRLPCIDNMRFRSC